MPMQSLLGSAQLEISQPRRRRSRCDGIMSEANQQKLGEIPPSGRASPATILLCCFWLDMVAPRGDQHRRGALLTVAPTWGQLQKSYRNVRLPPGSSSRKYHASSLTSCFSTYVLECRAPLGRSRRSRLSRRAIARRRPPATMASGASGRSERRTLWKPGHAPGVLTPIEVRKRLMLRAAWRRRCSFSTMAMRTKPSPSSP